MIDEAQKIDCGAFVSEKYFRHLSEKTFSAESTGLTLDSWILLDSSSHAFGGFFIVKVLPVGDWGAAGQHRISPTYIESKP